MIMRVLYFSKTGNTQMMAEQIAREYKCVYDKIPPAYPIERDKLTIIGVELSGRAAPPEVVAICKSITPVRTKNVAFFSVSGGDTSGITELKDIVKKSGVNVVASVFDCQIKSSLFSKGKVTDSDIMNLKKWVASIRAGLGE